MVFVLYYQEIRRTSRLVEHSESHELYDKLVIRKNEHEEEMTIMYSSLDIYNALNRWFHYLESGAEGEERAEGHGWYCKFLLRIDGEFVDITEHILNYFDKLKDKIAGGDVK